MRHVPVLLLLGLAAGCYTGQGSGEVALQSYDVTGFTGIALSSHGDVTVLPGDFAVTASAEDNVLPSLTVQRRGETLLIGREVDWIDGVRPTVPIRFTVHAPALAAVAISGSGSVAVRGFRATVIEFSISGSGALDMADLHAERLVLHVNGSGTVFATGIDVAEFTAELRGAARAAVTGVATVANVDAAGSVLYRGADLRSRKVVVEVGGAAQAFVWADEELDARINGAGRLGYRGNPAIEQTIQRDGESFALPTPAPSAVAAGEP